jgi:site-specific recombinase XerD
MIAIKQVWSKRKIIEGIRLLFVEHGAITPREIRRDYARLYNATQKCIYFGGWLKAVEAAGYADKYERILDKARRQALARRKKTRDKWSKKLIQKNIRALRDAGQSLYGGEARKTHRNLLRAAQSKLYFGSWKKAVSSIGVNYNRLERGYFKKKKVFTCILKDRRCRGLLATWQKQLALHNYHRVTIIKKLRDAQKFIGFFTDKRQIESLTEADVKKYLCSKEIKQLSARTVESTIISLRQFMEFCVKNGATKDNPFDEIERPQYKLSGPAALSEQELARFVGAIEELPFNELVKIRGRLMIELIVYCGLRQQEVISLKRREVDLVEMTLKVEQGKRKKDRLIPINEALSGTITKYLELRGQNYGRYLITNRMNNRQINSIVFYNLFRLLSMKAGLKIVVTPHLLRSTFATILFDRGAPIRAIQELMGHTFVNTTARYIQVSIGYLRKEMSKHPLLAASPDNKKP